MEHGGGRLELHMFVSSNSYASSELRWLARSILEARGSGVPALRSGVPVPDSSQAWVQWRFRGLVHEGGH